MSLGPVAVLGSLRKMRRPIAGIGTAEFGKVCRILVSGESILVTSSFGGVADPEARARQNQYIVGFTWDAFVQKQARRF